MTESGMVKYIAQLRQQGVLGANRINERTGGWLGMVASAAKEALKPDTAITAADTLPSSRSFPSPS